MFNVNGFAVVNIYATTGGLAGQAGAAEGVPRIVGSDLARLGVQGGDGGGIAS